MSHTIDGGTEPTDPTALPAPIRAYLAAHASRDDNAAASAFAPNATVTDEGKTHTGRLDIRAWRRRASTEYTYTTEVTGVRQEPDDVWIVAIRLEGNFPGHVADLEQRFTVRDGAIADLTIA
jgi:hypothetical protein